MKRSNIPFLIEVAEAVNSSSLKSELLMLKAKADNNNTPIVLPLIGEFSSGKTTLINALTNSQALETATKPTTATIFEVHFGAPSNCADILYEDGRLEHTDDIKSLENEYLKNAKVVTVFDTSTKVSPYTIIVDTPGISSPEAKHKQVLVDFLPSADGVILVVDINQQLTKSLTEFLKTVRLTAKEIYVVLTKSDTKAAEEIEKAKEYLAENCEIGVRFIAAISAKNGKLDELSAIFDDIEKRKEEIVCKADEKRLEVIADSLKHNISQLLEASTCGDVELQNKINEQNQKLKKMRRQIERLIQNVGDSLEPLNREETRKFEDLVTSKLNSLVNSGSKNYDAEAVNTINMTASAILGDYRQKVMDILAKEASSMPKDSDISVESIPGIDLSALSISGLSYGINLNELGHEYDNWIKTGVIAIGAVAAVSAVVATGGAAVAAEGAMTVATVADVADTVTDIGSALHNRNVASRIEKAVRFGSEAVDKYAAIDQFNQQGIGNQEAGKGMIDSLAGFIAEKTMSKPQRNRAVRLYLNDTLMPEFRTQITSASNQVLNAVKTTLEEAASASSEECRQNLVSLQEQLKTKKDETMRRMESLREMQTQILTLD